ncbi:hypothetical protein P3T76_005380 [Phytophthora citrophthora]|uniref:Crinkler effector protein N-terminal domain-containing protein n=1 Tax=Phytophthora citrophthora TaxID=4793 RepID=A0AAD9GSW5_9STRA|nr:hypothetical protein P3T76_005380 [Phytophthora citrophthora]
MVQCYGEGNVFSVEINRHADVETLQKVIVNKKKDVNDRFNVDPAELTLYLAGKKEDEETKWLKDDARLDDLLQGGISTDYKKMRSSWILDGDCFGKNFQPGDGDIHVLVQIPEVVANVDVNKAAFWLVTGSVESGHHSISNLYRIADAELGYYDPENILSDNKVQAFWYTNNDLFFSRKVSTFIYLLLLLR